MNLKIKKLSIFVTITILILSFVGFSVSTVGASPLNNATEIANADESLIEKIAELEEQGYTVDTYVIEVEGFSFISYEKGNIIGLIQFTEDNYTLLEIIMSDDYLPEEALFQTEQSETVTLFFDESGEVVNATSTTPTSSGFVTANVTQSQLCSILATATGTGIGAIYAAAAAIIAGPAAAGAAVFIVALIFDQGWSVVVNQCN